MPFYKFCRIGASKSRRTRDLLPLILLATTMFAQTPAITSVSPNGVLTSDPYGNVLQVEIVGLNFGSTSVVQWTSPGGQTTTVTPRLVTSQEMNVAIPNSAAPGTAHVSVANGGAVSNTVAVAVAPFSLYSITPKKASAGSAALPVSVAIVNASAATMLVFTPPGGASVSIPLGSGGSATIPAAGLASAGTAQVALADSQGDVSNALAFTIFPSITPTVTLTSSMNPALTGQAVTLTAGVSPAAVSGRVVFFDGATILGSATLSNGQAALTTRLDGSGLRSLRAYYQGTANYAPSSSTPFLETLHGRAVSTFQPAVSYATGKSPQAAVQADFNNDGRADLAVVNTSGNSVSVLIGNGDGTFQTHVDYGTDSQPGAIAAGDLNGDGVTDLAVVSAVTSTVSLLFGNGDGTFQSAVILPLAPAENYSPSLIQVALADMNGDGWPDIVVHLEGVGEVSVLAGNGDGTFRPPIISLVSPVSDDNPSGMAVGDFNGDGNADVMFQAIHGPNGFYYGKGNGDGTVSLEVPEHTSYGSMYAHLVSADFNGDGIPDVAGTQFAVGIGTISGNGSGQFKTLFSMGGTQTGQGLAVGDFNGDGIPDLFQAVGNVFVWTGNGDGTFAPGGSYGTGNGAVSVVTGDFNGDGVVDLALINSDDNTISVLLGSSGSSSGQSIVFPGIQDTPLSSGALTLSATATSGLPVSYSASPADVCKVSGSTLTLVSEGTCTVTAIQPGNSNYAAATPVTESFYVHDDLDPVPTGIANAASAGQAAPSVVAPGSYVAIYGTNFADGGDANATPGSALPFTLNGVQVLLGGMPMPLLYAASGQVNAVIPEGLAPSGAYPLLIKRGSFQSVPVNLSVTELQPGIYTVNTTGSGAGVVADAVTGALITSTNPAHAGENLVIYATGLGPLRGDDGSNEPADGTAAPSNVLYRTTSRITVTIGGVNAPVSFSGLTPTLTALYQINVQVPAGVSAGNGVPVVVSAADSASGAMAVSNQVTIAVQ